MWRKMKYFLYEEKNRHNIFMELLAGAENVLVINPSDDYKHPRKGEFKEDMKNLDSDFREVGADMRLVMRKYGSTNYCRR